MTKEDNLQLLSYLVAAEVFNQGKNIYECFLPIAESALLCNIGNKISISTLQHSLKDIFKIEVPKSTLHMLLNILKEQNKITIDSKNRIKINKEGLSADFWEERSSREIEIDNFFLEFNKYLVESGINLTLTQIKYSCCKWLYFHSIELASFIACGKINKNEIESDETDWEYSSHLVDFLMDIQSKKSEYFKTFLLLYNGAVQSSLLNFETKQIDNVCESNIKLSNIILDTNVILRMLNLQSEFDCSITSETLSMLKLNNAHFFILNQTIEEVRNSIKSFLNETQPYISYTGKYFKNSKIRMTGFLEATKRGVTRTEFLQNANKKTLEENISKLLDKNVTFINDFDEEKIKNHQICNLIAAKNRDTYGEKQALHDLCLIEYCREKRNYSIESIADVDSWVLTNDEKLTYWNQYNNNDYQECLTEIQLSNLAWIQRVKDTN